MIGMLTYLPGKNSLRDVSLSVSNLPPAPQTSRDTIGNSSTEIGSSTQSQLRLSVLEQGKLACENEDNFNRNGKSLDLWQLLCQKQRRGSKDVPG